MRIQNNGNVGIGTTAPSSTLTVNGTGWFSQPIYVGVPTAAGMAATKAYVDSAVSSGVNGGVNGTANYVPIFTGTNTVGNSAIYQTGGNVGIGTTAPGSNLQVEASSAYTSTSTTPAIRIAGDTKLSTGLVMDMGIQPSGGYPGIVQVWGGSGALPIALDPYGGNVGSGRRHREHRC